MADEFDFLSRWSRRKHEARRAEPARTTPAQDAAQAPPVEPPAASELAPAAAQPPLPPVESLTPDSDFKPFMGSQVDGDVRRQALKTLFKDPRYNVMDMMDVYVDDYSKPDPLPEGWLEKLEQVSRLGDRAGRDREEAERRKAEEQAREEGEAAPAGDPASVPEEIDRAEAAPAAAPESAETGPFPPNPPRSVGESST